MAGADVSPYAIPAQLSEHIYEERGVRTAAWRGIGAGANNFAIEAMIDALAIAAGKDPAAYRIALLKDVRTKKVGETAAQMADFAMKRIGLAQHCLQPGAAFPSWQSLAATVAVFPWIARLHDPRAHAVVRS